jgi:PEP-CTERM motif
MRKILLLSAVAAAALGVAGTAQASTISIGTSINGGAITTQASGATPGPVTFTGPVGAYNLDTVSGIDLTAASLDSNSINGTSNGTLDTLNVFISASDITSFSGLVQALSGLTVNFLSKGWTVTESTFEDNSNMVFGTTANSLTAIQLATNTFTSGPDIFTLLTPVSVTTPFSVTEEFVIQSNGFSGSANNTIDLSGTVPEPSTWAMLGLGFAGMGLLGLARRQKGSRYAF